MHHSIVTFRGQAALPGIFLTLTRVNRGRDYFFNISQAGRLKTGNSFSPLNSISYQLISDFRSYPIKECILSKGWNVEGCAFRMWLIGRIDQRAECAGLSFRDCCIVVFILAAMIRKYLEESGHETVGMEFVFSDGPADIRLTEIARILFEEFLRDIAPFLMEDMDLNCDN